LSALNVVMGKPQRTAEPHRLRAVCVARASGTAHLLASSALNWDSIVQVGIPSRVLFGTRPLSFKKGSCHCQMHHCRSICAAVDQKVAQEDDLLL